MASLDVPLGTIPVGKLARPPNAAAAVVAAPYLALLAAVPPRTVMTARTAGHVRAITCVATATLAAGDALDHQESMAGTGQSPGVQVAVVVQVDRGRFRTEEQA